MAFRGKNQGLHMFRNVLYYHAYLIFMLFDITAGTSADSAVQATVAEKKQNFGYAKCAAGLGILAAGYTSAAIVANNMWWKDGFNWGNPFDHVSEGEPFLEDDAYHLVGAAMLTEFNYRVFSDMMALPMPEIWAGGLAFVTYTGVECFDALEKSGRWGFSISDEIANCLGIGYWALHRYYPQTPFLIRLGLHKWGTAAAHAGDAIAALRDFDEYRRHRIDHYNILKVEAIYRFCREFHAGIALSKRAKPDNRDLWGITAGYDFMPLINRKTRGWWNEPLRYINHFAALSLGYTVWVQ
jgi:hypothetical protein